MVRAAILLLLLLLAPPAAQAEKRIALVIGNKDYKPGVGALMNPLNDVRIVGEALKTVGFEVLKPVHNARRADMLLAIHDYAAKLKAAGSDAVGFLYFSGHGVSSAGENYLIPVDVDEPSTRLLSVGGVKQSEILAILRQEAPNAAHYLVLDACRNTLQGTRGGKGFVPVGQQSGVLVAFAAEPGRTASDVGQGSGPYAAALAYELIKPGQTDLIMFHRVRIAVIQKTGGDQVPWTEDGIQRPERVMFGGDVKSTSPSPSTEQVSPNGPNGNVRPPMRCETVEVPVGNELRCLKPKDTFRDCPNCPEMVVVSAGEFMMGSPGTERERAIDEGPQRKVTIAKPYAIGKFEVTFAEWDACVVNGDCKHNPADQGWGRGKRPVINVSWNDISTEYLPWLLRKTGKSYRLLTEAEWEYAARAGTTAPFSTGRTITTNQANFNGNYSYGDSAKGQYRRKSLEGGSFDPNAFGLHDMHGNVGEWVEDCYKDNYLGAPIDGSVNVTVSACSRVLRGGSWSGAPGGDLRSAKRRREPPDIRNSLFGFRIARTL